jgi:RHS repeat-associated protein
MIQCAPKPVKRMNQLCSWHLSSLKVISQPMSALACTGERDCRTRTSSEHCTASESWTQTKYTYDPNTDRLTQYQFTVNSQSLTGTLAWNANSTLKSLVLADQFNISDNQTCNYVYDDLTRLQSSNCGSIWSQTFSYDSFGNIMKNGTASFAALYNSSTNRITSVGSFTPTYDSNGNILTDPAHTFSWDSAGKPVTIDTVNITYDALGRMAEQNRSGAYTQFVYSPHGGKLAIYNGQTLQKAMVPLPGGALAVIGPNGILYYGHADHLGSIRLGSSPTRTIAFDIAYAPFGETYVPSGSTDPAFTGQRQDSVTGLFDFPAREYSNEGRWSSPDPSGLTSFILTDPQSINRYAYTRNTPLSLVDPTGLMECVPAGCGGGWGGGGNDLSIIVDGIAMPSYMNGFFLSMLSIGAGFAQCPNNICSFLSDSGQFVRYVAFGTGANYYAYVGPGSLFYSPDAAGTAAVLFYGPQTTTSNGDGTRSELGGTIYVDQNGVFSYTPPTEIGPPCAEGSCWSTRATWVPDGTQQVGDWHTHPWSSDSGQFGGPAGTTIYMGTIAIQGPVWVGDRGASNPFPTYVSTPIGSSFGVFRISAGPQASVCSLAGPSLAGISPCP